MATTKDYRDFILEQLSLLDNITCKSMMGEYLLYYNGLLFGGIYDVDDVDNQETLRDIVLDTCKDLKK